MEYKMTKSEDEADVERLRQALIGYNKAYFGGELRYKPFCQLLWDNDGQMVAGISGSTFMDLMRVDLLWVDEKLRGTGAGSSLLEAAETFGKENGCTLITLDTFSFQAPGFYEKKGYSCFGTVEDCLAPGVTRYYYMKRFIEE